MANPTDHLATVRAALDLAGKATPGPWTAHGCSFQHGIVQRSGNGAAHGFQDDAPCSFDDGQANAAAIVALRNAAPAIAALADECAAARDRIATLEAELAQARAHRCGGIVLRAEDADRIAALLEDPPAPTPAMVALFAKAKE